MVIREDHKAMEKALVDSALNQAFNRLSKLVLAVSGGQNLVAVLSRETPSHMMCWSELVRKWTPGEGKVEQSYKSSDACYGALNSVKDWPLVSNQLRFLLLFGDFTRFQIRRFVWYWFGRCWYAFDYRCYNVG